MTLSVVFSTDENYLFYTAVAIASMAQTADRETFYKIYILCADELRDEEGIFSSLQRTFSNITIRQIVVDSHLFGNVFINNLHISKATFYRLVISDVLEEDKCIYLDADTLVLEDLTPLWETDLETYYIAGCRDIWIDWLDPIEREKRRIGSNIQSLDRYVNAGVLLFNLKKIREDKINVAFKEHLSHNYPFEDQDILNVCCYERILFLPTKWNRFNEVYGSWKAMQRCKLSMDGFLGQGGIIHFTNKEGRPWETGRAWRCQEWWESAGCFKETKAYKKIKSHIEFQDSARDFLRLYDCLKDYSRVIIWGYTARNMQLCEWIFNSVPGIQVFFADKDVKKQGSYYKGAKVLTHAEALAETKNCLYVITSKRWQRDICDDLMAHGVLERDLYLFYHKTEEYYRMLDEQYYEEELQEICFKERVLSENITRNSQLTLDRELQEKYHMSSWFLKG